MEPGFDFVQNEEAQKRGEVDRPRLDDEQHHRTPAVIGETDYRAVHVPDPVCNERYGRR